LLYYNYNCCCCCHYYVTGHHTSEYRRGYTDGQAARSRSGNTRNTSPELPTNIGPSTAIGSSGTVDSSGICNTVQILLIQSCDQLVNSDHSLTASGQHAMGCIRNGQENSNKIYDLGQSITFVYDRERKLLYFTGKFDKKEVPATDFQIGEVVPGKYKNRYSFECYDITTTTPTAEEFSTNQSELSVWERGAADARTILYYLSKDKNVLEVIRNGQPRSTSTTYQINPPLD
jgi:hypothetical protein